MEAPLTKNVETIDLTKCLFQVLGFLTVDVSSPFWTLVEDVEDRTVRGAIFSFITDIECSNHRPPADFTIVDVTLDQAEPDVSTMTQDEISDFDDYLHEEIMCGLPDSQAKLVNWIESNQYQIGGELHLITAYVMHVSGRNRQYVAIRRRLESRNICIIGTFDLQHKDDFMRPIIKMLGKVRAVTYNS